jgi:acyl-coenzyme A synthetase/AMP-(fatty) acid ligase
LSCVPEFVAVHWRATIRFAPEFPMTATGKPQKYVMREKMIAEIAAAGSRRDAAANATGTVGS